MLTLENARCARARLVSEGPLDEAAVAARASPLASELPAAFD